MLSLGWPGVSEPTPFPDSSTPATVRCTHADGGRSAPGTGRGSRGHQRAASETPAPQGGVLTASFSWTPAPLPCRHPGRRAAELDESAA